MKPYSEILEKIETFHELGETIKAAEFVLKEYGLENPNLLGFELREKAKPDYVLMTTEGNFGEKQIIRIPENTFEFEFTLMLNLIAHEMVHVIQKSSKNCPQDRNEREWQAYYEMLFHKEFPLIPKASVHHQKFFAEKAMVYYDRSEKEAKPLRLKYENQKLEIEELIKSLG